MGWSFNFVGCSRAQLGYTPGDEHEQALHFTLIPNGEDQATHLLGFCFS